MNNTNKILIGSVVLLVSGAVYLAYRRVRKSQKIKMAGDINYSKIMQMHPKARTKALSFISEVTKKLKDKGYSGVGVYETIRTPEKQYEYFLAGTSKVLFGWHIVGLAIDIYPLKNGQPSMSSYAPDDIVKLMREIGKKHGFDTIGDWDRPHYEMTFGMTLSEAKQKYDKKDFDKNGYINI